MLNVLRWLPFVFLVSVLACNDGPTGPASPSDDRKCTIGSVPSDDGTVCEKDGCPDGQHYDTRSDGVSQCWDNVYIERGCPSGSGIGYEDGGLGPGWYCNNGKASEVTDYWQDTDGGSYGLDIWIKPGCGGAVYWPDSRGGKWRCDGDPPQGAPPTVWCKPDDDPNKASTAWMDCIDNAANSVGWGNPFIVRLGNGYHLIDRHYQLPPGARVWGESMDGTFIKATRAVNNGCGEDDDTSSYPDYLAKYGPPDPKTRIGIVLNDDTYIGELTFRSLDDHRWQDYNGAAFCGGAAFETPGCTDAYCVSPSNVGNNGNGGIANAMVEHVKIVGDLPGLAPQMAVFVTETRDPSDPSHDIRIEGVTMLKSWADGINIHGSSYNVLVKGNWMAYNGDDNYAIWSRNGDAHDITFSNNWGSQSESTNPDKDWGACYAVYGGGANLRVLDSQCDDSNTAGVVFTTAFGGGFWEQTSIVVAGINVDEANRNGVNICGYRSAYDSGLPQGRVNNCPEVNDGSWSSCPEACFVHGGCSQVGWLEHGPLGVPAWYCTDGMGTNSDQYTWTDADWGMQFDDCCVPRGCGSVGWWQDGNMWVCAD